MPFELNWDDETWLRTRVEFTARLVGQMIRDAAANDSWEDLSDQLRSCWMEGEIDQTDGMFSREYIEPRLVERGEEALRDLRQLDQRHSLTDEQARRLIDFWGRARKLPPEDQPQQGA